MTTPVKQRERWVPRERLIARIRCTKRPRVTIFAAPAGFGKTTTMQQWAQEQAVLNVRTAWVSLDHRDNDESALLANLTNGLSHLLSDPASVQKAYRSSPVLSVEMVVKALISGLASTSGSISIFIDDYHLVESQTCKALLKRLVHAAPENIVFIIGSRFVPDLHLGKLRVQGEVCEFDVDDLRFDQHETQTFFDDRLGFSLRQDAASSLSTRAEGWVAALQLFALSIDGNATAEKMLTNFAGARRNIAEFLMEDVLAALPAHVTGFLFRSSIFERFTAEACASVLRCPNAEAIIAEIETRNLFLVPVDGERRWFRYHHLFRDFLVREMKRREPEAIGRLHLAAAEWFSQYKMFSEAIAHALACGDEARAATFVESHGLELISQCQLLQLRELLAILPDALIEQRVRLQLIVVWLAVHSSQTDIAKAALANAKRHIEAGSVAPDDPGLIAGVPIAVEMKVLESAVASTWEQFQRARDTSMAVLDAIPPGIWFLEGATANVLGYNLYALGDLEHAASALISAREAHRKSGSLLGITIANCYLAVVERAAGRLPVAMQLLRSAIADARHRVGPNSYAEAIAGSLLSELSYEVDDAEEAVSLVERLAPLIEDAAIILYPLASIPTYARALQLQGKADEALDMLQRVGHRYKGSVYRRLECIILHERVRILIDSGRVGEAKACFDRVAQDEPDGFTTDITTEFQQFARGRLLIAEGEAARACSLFERLASSAREGGRTRREMLALILCAKASWAGMDKQNAERFLSRALRLGCPGGFVRSFLDEGRPVLDTLERLAGPSISAEPALRAYVGRLLAIEKRHSTDAGKATSGTASDVSLTRREIEILEKLAQGMSNRGLAGALCLSEATVKWHLKNIFLKLNVKNRLQAVRVTKGLLETIAPPK